MYRSVRLLEEQPIVQAMDPEGMHQIENLDPVRTYRAVRIERKA
jgi:hypothetical protein